MPPIVISDIRGGRNGVDSPINPSFPMTQCVEAINVDWSDGALGRKRGGCDDVSLAGGTAPGTGIQAILRHMPSGDETAAELWLTDGTGLVKRLAGGTNWANITLADAYTGNKYETSGVSFNGKLYLGFKTAQGRTHCYDPLTGNVRRVGLAAPTAAPTFANSGIAGAYAAVIRYARVRWLQMNGTIMVRRSEPGPSAAFTPDAAHVSWRITQPAVPNEGETHWEIEVSLDNTVWSILYGVGSSVAGAQIAIGTTFKDDSTATGSFTGFTPSDLIGTYSLFPSFKFMITDGNRLIGMGSYDTATEPHQSRVWFSPVLGSADHGDDERWVNSLTQKNQIDLNENDGGAGTGLGGTVQGVFWAFKYRSITKFLPTGDLDRPYQVRKVSDVVGAINQASIRMAEDAAGNPAIYFASYKGPYRLSGAGLEYLGRDVEDVWRGLNGYSGVNLAANVVCHSQYYSSLSQWWLWVATGASTIPDTLLVLDVRQAIRGDKYGVRGGWSVFTGEVAAAYCSAVFANTLGASMSKDLKPYIGRNDSHVYKCDTTAQNDNGTAFWSYWISRSIVPTEAIGHNFTIGDIIIEAKAQAGATIRVTVIRDFGFGTKASDIALDPKKSETRVIRKFGSSTASEMGVIQVQVGDPQAMSQKWSIGSMFIPVEDEGDK